MDNKMYLLHKKHYCQAMTKNKLKLRKCIRSKKCHIIKCGNLIEDYNKSQLTEKDLQECMKYENNMNKAMKCKNDVEQKKGLDIKQGKIEQCIATECPESHNIEIELVKDLQKNINNNKNTNTKNTKKKLKCKKINDEIEDLAIQRLNITNECNKKHESYKKQQECNKPIMDKIWSINYKLEKCMNKQNNNKQNNNKQNNKK
jgi:hypothetical protein